MRMIVFMLLLSRLAPAADWRTGQLIDVSSERVFAGTADDPGSVFEGRRAQYVIVRRPRYDIDYCPLLAYAIGQGFK